MPEVEVVRKEAIRGAGRNIILVVLITAVSFLSWRIHQHTILVASVNLSARTSTQPASNSSSRIYYISPQPLYVVVWVGTALAAIFTVARTRLQYSHNRRLYINDYLICLALIFQLILSVLYQVMSPPMYGLEAAMYGLEQVTTSNIPRFEYYLRLQFAVTYVFWSALWSVKLALLTFFWRLFESVRTQVRPFWWFMCSITIVTWTISLFLQGFACKPASSFFKLGGCSSPSSVYGANLAFHFSSICDIITDFLIMLTPFPLLRKLQINIRQKAILVVIFLLPLFVIAFAILRLVETNASGTTVDPIRLALFSTVEVSCSIMAACLPSIRLFFIPRSAMTSRNQRSYSRRNEAAFESLPHKDILPLQTFVRTRPPNDRTDSAESILRADDKIHVRRDFLVSEGQV